MNGFEIFLCILAGIILLIVSILSIPVHVSFSYEDKIFLSVRYLFLKFRILPQGEKKEKKPKKEKKKKEKPAEEPKEETPKEKKPNPLLNMVKANGYDGMMEVLRNLGSVLARYGSQLFKSVIFDEFDIYVVVGKGDAAATAIEYGKACQRVYPLAGFLCSNNVVHKYDVSVESDFLAGKSVVKRSRKDDTICQKNQQVQFLPARLKRSATLWIPAPSSVSRSTPKET